MASDPADPAPDPAPASQNPMAMLRSRSYLVLLVFGAIVGVPVAVIAYYFLKLVALAQKYLFTTLPGELGFHGQPPWWPVPVVALGGVLVSLTLRCLPGTGGHHPAEGFKAGGKVAVRDLPAIVFAALATVISGAVLGPEAPLILVGAGVATLIVHLVKKDAPAQAVLVIGAAGSFAALSTLLVNPLVGAFLLLEVAGIGGGMISVMLAPGLLAAGVGALIFVGLDKLTGFWTFSLAIPHQLQPIIGRRKALTPVLGLAIGGLAALFTAVTGKGTNEVLFSGQNIGAAGGIALSHLPGLISVVIVAVVVAWVASAHLSRWLPLPSPAPADEAGPGQ